MSIKDLDPNTPGSNDSAGFGDDQIRALKVALQAVFPEFNTAIKKSNGTLDASSDDLSALFDSVDALTGGVGVGIVGEIKMWYGTYENIPAGWQVCDGSNGTPDLVLRFPQGADNNSGLPTVGGVPSGGQYDGLTFSAGNHTHGVSSIGSHTLTVNNLPEHNHRVFGAESSIGDNPVGANDAASFERTAGSDENQRYEINKVPLNPTTVEPTLGRTSNAGQGSPSSLTHSGTTNTDGAHQHAYSLPNWWAVYYIMYVGV